MQRIPEDVQLARARDAHDTHKADEYLILQATHSFVLSNYELPNRRGGFSINGPETFPLELIDAFFAALRIAAAAETGYGQLLIEPDGWAHRTVAQLPPVEGTVVRAYPPTLRPVSPFYGNDFRDLSDADFESVRELFAAITSIRNSASVESERLKLAINRLNRCYLREHEEDAILDATIGMEILLSDGDSAEVTHKLALRLAALASLVPKYKNQTTTVFRNVKSSIYPYRSAVVHGNESRASKKREIRSEKGETIPAVQLATEYLGMAVQAIASHPEFLSPGRIDEKLLLGGADANSEPT